MKVIAYNCIGCSSEYSKKVSKEGYFYFTINIYDCLERVYSHIDENNIDIYECSTFKKENLEDNLNEVINGLDISKEKNYIINGQDYKISITPVDYLISNVKTIEELFYPKYENFTECEKILREFYSIPSNIEIGFFRIDLNTQNEDEDEFLYKAYYNKINLNLSLCIKTTIPTTIPSTIPTTITTSILTIIYTTIPTTFTTTIPTKNPTTIPTTIVTTIPTKNPTTIITTIPTKIPTTIVKFQQQLLLLFQLKFLQQCLQ